MIGCLDTLIRQPNGVGSEHITVLRHAGLTDRAILDALYICAGFSIIVRLAAALGFQMPPQKVFARGAKFLLVFGYKPLSGQWWGRDSHDELYKQHRSRAVAEGSLEDPYRGGMQRLKHAVLAGSGFLESHVRQVAAAAGDLPGSLGHYVQKVAHNANDVTDDDIVWLRTEGYTEDQIFEATVSAALGAGLLRLKSGLQALQVEQLL